MTDHGKAVARLVPLDRPRPLDRLIAAHAVADSDLVLVTGDTDLAAAASVLGISVAATNS